VLLIGGAEQILIRFAHPTGSRWLSISASLRFRQSLAVLQVGGEDEAGVQVHVETAVFPGEEVGYFVATEESVQKTYSASS